MSRCVVPWLAMELPLKLIPELVTSVANFLSLWGISKTSSVCRSWRQSVLDERLWTAVFHRQWSIQDPQLLGAHFSEGWQQICRAFCTVKAHCWQPKPDAEQSATLGLMSKQAQRFLFGIAHGYVPTSDGLFTFHAHGATPIHYRHTASRASTTPFQHHCTSGLRLSGTWLWSADREFWFATSTCDISQGCFARGGWRLVADNMDIVNFLDRWPLVPMLASPLTLRSPAAVTCHTDLNSGPIDDFMEAIGRGPQPTTSCVATRVFTVHLHFAPALCIRCTDDGFKLSGPPSKHKESAALLETLNHSFAGTEFDEIIGPLWLPPLSDYIRERENWFRRQVLRLPDTAQP